MLLDLEVSHSVDINASTAKVWEALTNPAIIKEYLFGTETVTDWKVGSPIFFQGDYNGITYKDKGVILKFEPEHELSYSYWSGFSGLEDVPENYSTVTYTVTGSNDHSTFTWTQRGYANEARYEHSKNGMADFLNNVKLIVEQL